jgi:hypothetical protein
VLISGLLTPIGKTSREALISEEPTKFVVKIISSSEFKYELSRRTCNEKAGEESDWSSTVFGKGGYESP